MSVSSFGKRSRKIRSWRAGKGAGESLKREVIEVGGVGSLTVVRSKEQVAKEVIYRGWAGFQVVYRRWSSDT